MPIFNLFKNKKTEEPAHKIPISNDYDENLPFFVDDPIEDNSSDTDNLVSNETVIKEDYDKNATDTTEKKKYDREQYRKRTVSVRFRMTPEEKEKLDAAYKASGAKNLQEYLLASALNGPIIPKSHIQQYQAILERENEILKQVHGMANNVNQLAKYANTKKEAGDLSDLKNIVDEMRKLYSTSALSTAKAVSKYTKVR